MSIMEGYLMPHPPVLIPEIGKGKENECEKTLRALNTIGRRIETLKPKTIVFISPHGPVFSDGIGISYMETLNGSFKNFGSPNISFEKENNLSLVDDIVKSAVSQGIAMAKIDKEFAAEYDFSTELDHGVLVPLYFINKYYQKFKIINITYGLLSRPELYKFGMCLKDSINKFNEDVIIVGSGDLSHKLKSSGPYEFSPAGAAFDEKIMKYLENGDFLNMLKMDSELIDAAGECGYRSLNILAGTFDRNRVEGINLSYEGPFGVGYGVVQFKPIKNEEILSIYGEIDNYRKLAIQAIREKEDVYVKFARKVIENYILKTELPEIDESLPGEMLKVIAGVFVSIKSNGGLRGCMGTISPTTTSVAKEITANAIKASTEDPRFDPIEPYELDDLIISVDILKPAEKISSIDELDVKRFGIIVTSDYKRALLLPNLDGINTVEEQLEIVLRKAGISKKEEYEMERFEVIRHE